MRRLLLLPLLGAALVVAPAGAQDADLPLATPLQLNVDRDPEPETIRVREISCFDAEGSSAPPCDTGDPGVGREITVELVNVCDGVERATPLFVRVEQFVTVAEAVEVDGAPGREFLVGGASGASGRNGQLVLGAVRDTGDGCPKLKRLMALGPVKAKTRKPAGASYFATGGLVLASLRREFRGKEIVVSQPWYTRSDGGCCPTFVSTGYYRYRSSTDSYVRYKSRTMRTEAE